MSQAAPTCNHKEESKTSGTAQHREASETAGTAQQQNPELRARLSAWMSQPYPTQGTSGYRSKFRGAPQSSHTGIKQPVALLPQILDLSNGVLRHSGAGTESNRAKGNPDTTRAAAPESMQCFSRGCNWGKPASLRPTWQMGNLGTNLNMVRYRPLGATKQRARPTPKDQVRILVTASSLKGHARQPTGANSTRAFLLERCLEVQALRCRWSDDARPLHLPASHAEPVGMLPVVNIACSTITQGVVPMGCETNRRYFAHVCNACIGMHGRIASS